MHGKREVHYFFRMLITHLASMPLETKCSELLPCSELSRNTNYIENTRAILKKKLLQESTFPHAKIVCLIYSLKYAVQY